MIDSKVDSSWPHAEKLRSLIHESTSMDDVFESIVVPVLLTYDSPTTKAHVKRTQEYVQALTTELERHYQNFHSKNPLTDVMVRLILFPLQEKKQLVKAMDEYLKGLQCL
ncbi:Hachiman antiphage defense system protein HamA [Burkholderia sp. 22PA0099]|uniref:Hachiman antiphage defense system protein HamA n=1 Tax=Burkholderia sp. 22PA0099 TaxID=3237372 RepID=UPI0039C448AF